MANWTPEGFVGQMFKTFSRFIAPSGMPAPVLWGDETVVRERLGHGVFCLTMSRRHYNMSYPFPPADVVEFFRQYYGPTNRAFASLGENAARELRKELEALWSSHNRGGDELTVVPAEYLEVIIYWCGEAGMSERAAERRDVSLCFPGQWVCLPSG